LGHLENKKRIIIKNLSLSNWEAGSETGRNFPPPPHRVGDCSPSLPHSPTGPGNFPRFGAGPRRVRGIPAPLPTLVVLRKININSFKLIYIHKKLIIDFELIGILNIEEDEITIFNSNNL